ncbi:anion permease, partial [Cellulomonas sp. GbtcB1]|uniref:anion permease n=1 Tax=Cellulomonas sp. GbtcB1 TaxID=2824746 RepID=UPI0034D4DCC1
MSLIVVAFYISRGVIKTELDARLPLIIVSRLGRSPIALPYGLAATHLVLD